MQGLLGALPPLDDIFKSAGMELPSYLKGQPKEETADNKPETTAEKKDNPSK